MPKHEALAELHCESFPDGASEVRLSIVSEMGDWFAVYVRPRSEKKVAAMLRYKGYEDFLPLYRSARSWSDRMKQLDLPLFPGYVFCRFNPQHKVPVISTPGVLAVVGFGGEPAPVDGTEITNLRILVKSGRPACPWAFMQTGNPVRVERGPLRGVEGLLISVKGMRLVISVNLLQRSVVVDLDADCVSPIKGPATPATLIGSGAHSFQNPYPISRSSRGNI